MNTQNVANTLTNQQSDKPSPAVLAAFAKSLSERNILLDSNNQLLAHVSDSQLFSKFIGQDREFTPAHNYQLDNLTPTWDTVIRLATIIVKRHKRAEPEKIKKNQELMALHRTAEGLEALTWINGVEPVDVVASAPNGGKNYQTIVRDFGLGFLLELSNIVFDGHETGVGKTRIGITAVCPPNDELLDELEVHLLPVTDKTDLFTYVAPSGQTYDVIAKPVTTGRRVTAVRYRFVQTDK